MHRWSLIKCAVGGVPTLCMQRRFLRASYAPGQFNSSCFKITRHDEPRLSHGKNIRTFSIPARGYGTDYCSISEAQSPHINPCHRTDALFQQLSVSERRQPTSPCRSSC